MLHSISLESFDFATSFISLRGCVTSFGLGADKEISDESYSCSISLASEFYNTTLPRSAQERRLPPSALRLFSCTTAAPCQDGFAHSPTQATFHSDMAQELPGSRIIKASISGFQDLDRLMTAV